MTKLKEYIRKQHNSIGQVLRRERLLAHAVATIQGPLTLTYRLRMDEPTTQNVKRFLGLDTALQASLQVEAVRVQQVKGLIEIQVPSPAPATPNASQMADASKGLNVAIGWDAFGKPVHIDLRQHGAVFWVGPSRRGKTQSMRSTLYALCRGYGQALRYAIICQRSKLEDWQAFDGAGHSMGVVSAFNEIETAVKWFANRTHTGRGRYEYVVLVDDLPSILQQCKIAKELADIASVGAGVGVHLLAGTQAAGSKQGSGGEIIESNITARIVYKPASKATAARNAGTGGLDLDQLSSAKGDAVLLIDGYPERVATSIAYDRKILTLPQKRIESMYHVWLKSGAVQPPVQGSVHTGVYAPYTPPYSPVTGEKQGDRPVRPVYPVQPESGLDHEALRLPATMNLTPQQKLQLYAAYQYFGTKGATQRSVFGGEGGKQSQVLNDAIAYAESQQGNDEKIIKLEKRRVA